MRFVRYVGPAHRRMISSADWKSGRMSGDTVVWDASNGFVVPIDQFSDEQIKKAIEPDASLMIVEMDDDFEVKPGPYDMTPREYAQWVENPVDVPALLEGVAAGSVNLSDVPSVPAGAAPTGNTNTERRAEVLEDTEADRADDPDASTSDKSAR